MSHPATTGDTRRILGAQALHVVLWRWFSRVALPDEAVSAPARVVATVEAS